MSGKIHALVIPKYGMVMTEGVLASWHVEEGSRIRPGDELIDIETEKIANAYESQIDGILRRRVAQQGETLAVGALFGVISDASVPEGEIDAFVAEFQAKFTPPDVGEREAAPKDVRAGEYRIRYLRTGEATGVPLLLVHGFAGDLNNWLFNQEVLSAERMVYAMDLPGHGGSQKSVGKGDVPALARTMQEFLGALAIKKVHLVGHSLGGGIALFLALNHPALVASLTLISPIGLGSEINATFIRGVIETDRRKEMKAVLQELFSDPELVSREMVMNVLNSKRIDGAVQCLRSVADNCFPGGKQRWVVPDTLSQIPAPVQIIWGKDDKIIPACHAAGLSGSTAIHVLDNAGHMAHMEKARDVNKLIQQFVGAG